ncbi:MAG: hypothetical protein IPL36_03765 [Nigerium sp.]|nr:hypothetical protein [Nigerium sp.]
MVVRRQLPAAGKPGYGITLGHALVVTASGWLAMHLLSWALAALIGGPPHGCGASASGQPVIVTLRDILAGTPFIPVNAVLSE